MSPYSIVITLLIVQWLLSHYCGVELTSILLFNCCSVKMKLLSSYCIVWWLYIDIYCICILAWILYMYTSLNRCLYGIGTCITYTLPIQHTQYLSGFADYYVQVYSLDIFKIWWWQLQCHNVSYCKRYIERKGIPMIVLWCPAFSNNG